MSKTLLNRLAMLEVLDSSEGLTITELAERSGLDVSVVSRTVSACERDGWVARRGNRVIIGLRATLLGQGGPFAQVIAAADPLVHALAGATGLTAHAYALVGSQSIAIASAAGVGHAPPRGLSVKAPLHATAGGRAIASTLEPELLDSVLPPDPLPDPQTLLGTLSGTSAETLFQTSGTPSSDEQGKPALATTRAELEAELDEIRSSGFADDHGALHPALHCIAVAWPQAVVPAALACLGSPDAVRVAEPVARRALQLAARPGATPHSVLAAIAEATAGEAAITGTAGAP
jgi:DNA-binding IclR family transcriptional regulator